MTKFEAPSFSVFPGAEKNYRDNYDRIFGKKKDKPDPWADKCGHDCVELNHGGNHAQCPSRKTEPKKMSDLPPPRDAQPAPAEPAKKPKKAKKNEKTKTKKKTKKK